eukprot:Skav209570  [mRNA]  locus=scaffold281:130830:132662:- [translate_table: standard]
MLDPRVCITFLEGQWEPAQELKEKRYTNTGHHVFMKALLGATPEICQIRKLNRQLYVKPPTPPPVQPPKPKATRHLQGCSGRRALPIAGWLLSGFADRRICDDHRPRRVLWLETQGEPIQRRQKRHGKRRRSSIKNEY